MFNFFVVLAGHDMVTDTDRASTWWRIFKAPRLQTKITKNEGPSEKGFHGKPFEDFRRKKTLSYLGPNLKKLVLKNNEDARD